MDRKRGLNRLMVKWCLLNLAKYFASFAVSQKFTFCLLFLPSSTSTREYIARDDSGYEQRTKRTDRSRFQILQNLSISFSSHALQQLVSTALRLI